MRWQDILKPGWIKIIISLLYLFWIPFLMIFTGLAPFSSGPNDPSPLALTFYKFLESLAIYIGIGFIQELVKRERK